VNPFRSPDPDKVPGLPLAEGLEVVFVTDANVVLGKIEVLRATEELAPVEELTAVEELGGGAGLSDFGRY
jgi:hypothetical protein